MTSAPDALVVGAGGFLGGHLVRSLLLQGLEVRAVDIRPVAAWNQVHADADNRSSDLSVVQNAVAATSGATTVYDLAAAPHDAPSVDRMTGVLTDTHLLLAARDTGVDRFVFASSAVDVPAALAASSPDDRCWRHLFSERMARHFLDDFGLQTRVARLGPVYGELGGHRGPTAELPVVAAIAHLVATAVARQQATVDIPFHADDPASQIYVDDAVLGLQLVAHGTDDCGPHVVVDPDPTTVSAVVDAVIAVADATVTPRYTGGARTPRVVGDTVALVDTLGWQPDISLEATLERFWSTASIEVRRRLDLPPNVADRWNHRRRTVAGSAVRQVRTRATAPAVGRHRYENAG